MPFLRLNVLNAHDITWANRATAPSKINSSRVITRAGLWHRNVPHRRFSPCIIYWPLLMFALWRSFRTMLPSSMVAHFFYSCYGMERHSRNGKLLRSSKSTWVDQWEAPEKVFPTFEENRIVSNSYSNEVIKLMILATRIQRQWAHINTVNCRSMYNNNDSEKSTDAYMTLFCISIHRALFPAQLSINS